MSGNSPYPWLTLTFLPGISPHTKEPSWSHRRREKQLKKQVLVLQQPSCQWEQGNTYRQGKAEFVGKRTKSDYGSIWLHDKLCKIKSMEMGDRRRRKRVRIPRKQKCYSSGGKKSLTFQTSGREEAEIKTQPLIDSNAFISTELQGNWKGKIYFPLFFPIIFF